jgi:hypothetical protein
MSAVTSFARLLRNLFALGANLLPAYGVLYLGVDPFQLLMLYWMETAVIGFWMVMTLARLPGNQLGNITIDGRVQHATNAVLVELFGAMTLIFMAGHLLLLWVLFSGDWPHHVTGPISFVHEFVIGSGAWVPLSLTFLAGFAGFCHSAARPDFVGAFERRLYPVRTSFVAEPRHPSDGVGPVVGTTLGRIATMQVAVIIGAMLSRSYGSQAPLLIMIGLKTLFGFQRGSSLVSKIPVRAAFSGNGTTTALAAHAVNPAVNNGGSKTHASPE